MLTSKKIAAVLLSAVMLLTMTACGSSAAELSAGSEASASASVATEDTGESSQPTEATEQSSEVTEPVRSDSQQTQSSDSEASTAQSEPAEAVTSTQDTTASTPQTSAAPSESSGLAVAYTIPSTWEESGKHCTQIEFTVKNGSDKALSGWSVVVSLGQQCELMQQWNATVTPSGSSFTAVNAEYNGEVAAGAETTFGCIIKTPSKVSGISSISINGRQAEVNGSTPKPDSTATQTATAATVSKPPAEVEIESTGKYGLVSDIGQLSVKGTDLVGEDGAPAQLRGVSTHGIQWFPAFANKQAFKYLRDNWNINTIRIAMYSGAGEGYTDSTKAGLEQLVQDCVDACIELDMYVIIDWHLLGDQSPQVRKADALRFFEYMSKKYSKYPNVIYEICNEPNGYASWSGDVKPYAEEVIPVIRKNDPDSVVIVGTPTWSQDIDKALADPLKFDNVMYALHYYAATHGDWLRDRVKKCYNSGLPIFVSEFGNCDASGGGSNNLTEAKKWLTLFDELNISYINWALSDKNETCSILTSGASATGGWTDSQLTESGRFMRDWFLAH